jgi:hypothetical protein
MNAIFKAALLCSLINFYSPAWSVDLTASTGATILTVSGKINGQNSADKVEFDLADLEAMGKAEIQTSTIWTDGLLTFVGVPLNVLVDRFEVEGGTILASAINDYVVRIPVSDAVPNGPIIAYRLNGKEMSVRDKGPLWVVYPFDSNETYQSEVIYSRSIWQLDRLEFTD